MCLYIVYIHVYYKTSNWMQILVELSKAYSELLTSTCGGHLQNNFLAENFCKTSKAHFNFKDSFVLILCIDRPLPAITT